MKAAKPGQAEAARLLSAWSSLESLSPRTFKDPADLVSRNDKALVVPVGAGEPLPWHAGIKASPGKNLYFRVPIGVIPVAPAMKVLSDTFGDHESRQSSSGEAALAAMLVVDEEGRPMRLSPPVVSSFGWSVSMCLQGKYGELAKWTESESKILMAIQMVVGVDDEDSEKGKFKPLTEKSLAEVQRVVRSALELPPELYAEAPFALIAEVSRTRKAPQAFLMNSFYLDDLEQTRKRIEAGRCGRALAAYLGVAKAPNPVDLAVDRDAVASAVVPPMTPAAKWPMADGSSLVTLQQAAVNLSFFELGQGGLLAVNGPPGTGKTTLLRDVVAGVVLARAEAMCKFWKPAEAFSKSGFLSEKGQSSESIYSIDPSLLGFEVVVASSNNRAVENVTRELPASKAVGAVLRQQGYYKPLAAFVGGPLAAPDRDEEDDGEDDAGLDLEADESWGLISAVLGRKSNRGAFVGRFWDHADWSFKHYLDHCLGKRVAPFQDVDGEGNVIASRMPRSVSELDPPEGPQAALGRWNAARQRFRLALKASRDAMDACMAEGSLGVAADADFFASGHEAWNLATPWLDERARIAREACFAAALEVHVAFVAAAAGPMSANLSAACRSLMGRTLPNQHAARCAFAALTFVVPVVSSTFASFARAFGQIADEGIGWLLIDEAGQSLPQAAVGAIRRARRVVAVGDPLQIEPVVKLPEGVGRKVAEAYGLDADEFLAPMASTQALADRSSRYRGSFRAPDGEGRRTVGAPLLVHRRCQEPMFSMSNAMAYDGQMVFAVSGRPAGAAEAGVGRSHWIDVPAAPGQFGKWSEDEGDALVDLFARMAGARIKVPDCYILSPFREVANRLRGRLVAERQLLSRLGVGDRWVADRTGTVHVAQGREASAIFLVLGAPGEDQNGARYWASNAPNVMNVAVSRARDDLYVIGNRAAWGQRGNVAHISSRLDSVKFSSRLVA